MDEIFASTYPKPVPNDLLPLEGIFEPWFDIARTLRRGRILNKSSKNKTFNPQSGAHRSKLVYKPHEHPLTSA